MKTLDSTKQALRSKYIGHDGIHGFGIRRASNAVCVYLDTSESHSHQDELPKLVLQMKREAHPFKVIVVESARAQLA
jgi:hypothetical protein